MPDPGADDETDWAAVFAAAKEGNDEYSDWVRLTPEIVAIISLRDCKEQLNLSAIDPVRLALAAKSAHLSLQAALTAALAGSMNVGAYPEPLRIAWLQYLQGTSAVRPEETRVLAFKGLLKKALASPLEWSGQPLAVSDEQQGLLDRLSDLRDDIEHTKTRHWSIDPAYIKETLPVATHLTQELLEVVQHHLEPEELDQVKQYAEEVAALCASAGPIEKRAP